MDMKSSQITYTFYTEHLMFVFIVAAIGVVLEVYWKKKT